MSTRKPKSYLAVLDVGHGNAAVLCDEGGTVVFDAGRGAILNDFLVSNKETAVQAMLLSHADIDHIGGAITVLLNPAVKIGAVYLNPDATKDTDVFRQLRFALCEAEMRQKTSINASLTTQTNLPRKGAKIEVLYPSPIAAIGGVGGKGLKGKRTDSNSLSAAIRVTASTGKSILLGGDIEFDCVDEWKKSKADVLATALVFPHHGGLPGQSDESTAELFAHEITKIVGPSYVIFSVHRTLHKNPRQAVLSAITKAHNEVRFICTQLPDKFHASVKKGSAWETHCGEKNILEGTISIKFTAKDLIFSFPPANN